MPWKTFSPGGGLAAPYFPSTTKYVAGIPLNGKGNIYPGWAKGKSNAVVRPGGTNTPAGGNKGLKFS